MDATCVAGAACFANCVSGGGTPPPQCLMSCVNGAASQDPTGSTLHDALQHEV
jgi:hypothetical protein